jgi:glycosyltransferase involved in cell wall biosynthesis
MYNIAQYLPAFFASLESQTVDISDIEAVFVDDGSQDDSADLVERWLSKNVVTGRVIRQANAGPAEARNRGLVELTGEWVTFPDPDDLFSANYFEVVREFLSSPDADGVHLVSTNLLMLDDATGEITDTHPLRAKFAGGRQVLDLEDNPGFIHLQSASAFYRRAPIADTPIRFDARVRPNFEDAHFTAYYLATFEGPRVAVLPEAEYHYRRRSDGSSLIQGSWGKREKYTQLPEFGYLAVLRHLHEVKGRVPSWAQTLIVYDLSFFFRHDSRPNSATAAITPEDSRRFHDLLRQILAYVDASGDAHRRQG